ncbi:MAG: antiporter [Verrucomicrobiaceae bacterium]|nr:antiporter [Verrucomicrobiaceae bacterium]
MTALYALLVGASLLFLSIVLTPLSTRIGLPVLLLFFGVGMAAGENGPGGIQFHDFNTAFLVGNLALAIILLDGGMRTKYQSFRVGLKPATALATIGVLVTAGITGIAAIYLLHLPLLHGLLMGTIVASTDAAAVFSLLQGRGLHLNERVSATLEIESGTNDPMAIFLTILLLEMIEHNSTQVGWGALRLFLQQFGIGAIGGVLGGYLLSWLVRKLDLAIGLYSLLVVTAGITVFAVVGLLEGSGFLAIYLVGLRLGNSGTPLLTTILQVHDGLAWLAQIGLFLILGLLVTPAQMLPMALPALALALILMFVARPLAVVLSLRPFGLKFRELTFISWVGLRGAVPIVLALFPIMAQIPEAKLLFNVTCVVVLISLLIQGTTLATAARKLKLEVPAPRLPQRRIPLNLPDHSDHELYLLPMQQLQTEATPVQALRLPKDSFLLAVFRERELLLPQRDLQLLAGDWLAIASNSQAAADIGKLLAAKTPEHLAARSFFGAFTLAGDALLADLEAVYGLEIDPDLKQLSLSEVIAQRHRGHPVVGDRVDVGPVQLVVMAMVGDRVTQVGMKLPEA